ncbi:hypothetical protein TNCV_4239961 [Trichonephila clavipes]|nr:hypothetical protein TNCV_4239961 [Trichonephila clavipes]
MIRFGAPTLQRFLRLCALKETKTSVALRETQENGSTSKGTASRKFHPREGRRIRPGTGVSCLDRHVVSSLSVHGSLDIDEAVGVGVNLFVECSG